MRALAVLLLLAPSALAASSPGPVRAAEAEARAAEAEQTRLERLAEAARSDAAKLRAAQVAAAQAIVAAEARISAADAADRLARERLAALNARLESRQRPVAALLGGLAMMARRPPLLALAERSSTDEMVRVRLLLDSTLPVIRSRAAELTAEVERLERFERRSALARNRLARSREQLHERQQAFAALEARALRLAEARGAGALGAGDVALAAGEELERLTGEAASAREAAGIARDLAALGPAPLRPTAAPPPVPPLRYRLPTAARVTNGFGAVSDSGIRSRGITLATARGSPVAVPATGTVRFAGPFRDYDGIVIIDHGGGWMSLILNVSTPLKRGQRVRLGGPLGRALGAIEVELARNGTRVSPALIAGSSQSLSNGGEDG